jgi:hypothetical protein
MTGLEPGPGGIPPELLIDESAEEPQLETAQMSEQLWLAFAPLHKRAMGVAVGLTLGLLLFVLTAFHLLVLKGDPSRISLLREYFYGYEVSWKGACLGFFWGFVTGFVMGWFAAFMRNLILTILIFMGRTRDELAATRGFLDHI